MAIVLVRFSYYHFPQIRMNVRDDESEGAQQSSSPAGQESHLSMISLIHYLDTSYFQHLSAVYLCHLGILCFPSFPPNRPNNTKFTINLLLILNTENSQV